MLAILTAIHGRHALAARMLAHTAAGAAGVCDVGTARIFAVMSPEDEAVMAPLCRQLGISFVTQRNSPLSHKWQAGIAHVRQQCRKQPLRGIMTLGSDDFVSQAYLRTCFDLLVDPESSGWGLDRIYVLDAETGRLGRWDAETSPKMHHPQAGLLSDLTVPAGAGRVYTTDLLGRIGWTLWRQGRDNGLDMACSLRLQKLGYSLDVVRDESAVIVDVKTASNSNLHSWGDLRYAEVLEHTAAGEFLSEHGLRAALQADQDITTLVREMSAPAEPMAATKRIGLWIKSGGMYSGGRIALTMYGIALARAGAEVWFITDGPLAWQNDYHFPENFHLAQIGDPYPEDLDLLVTDCRGAVARECVAFKCAHPNVPLAVVAFETPNWAKRMDHELGHMMAREDFSQIEQHADMLIAISREGAKHLADFYRDGKPIDVIYPAINTEAIDKAAPHRAERPYVVFCARPTRHKHGEAAVLALMKFGSPMDMVRIGAPGLYKPVGNPDHRIQPLHGVSDLQKFALIKGAAAVLAPSTFEGFGLVPGEALACGTPVVAYDLPVLREVYGDDVAYARHGDEQDFIRAAHEVMAAPKPDLADAQARTRAAYGFEGLPERVQKARHHAITRPVLSVATICYATPAPLVEAMLESVYGVADEINIAYGPVPFWRDYPEGGTLDAIHAFPDPERKIKIIHMDVWDDKRHMWEAATRFQTGNYQLVTGADMIWAGLDRWLAAGIKWGTPRWVNFWHDLKHWIYGPVSRPGRWGERLEPFGSLCRHRLFGWWRHSYRWDAHTEPVDFAGNALWTIEGNLRAASDVPECVCYHLGHILPRRIMDRKHAYYTERDGDEAHGRHWREWDGGAGECGDGIVERVRWKLPAMVEEAAARLAEYAGGAIHAGEG